MSLSRRSTIVNAFIGWYLDYRCIYWGLQEIDPDHLPLPLDGIPHRKIKSCLEILSNASDPAIPTTTLLFQLAEIELAEKEELAKVNGYFMHRLISRLKDRPLLEETCRAIRSMILTEMTDNKLQTFRQKLQAQLDGIEPPAALQLASKDVTQDEKDRHEKIQQLQQQLKALDAADLNHFHRQFFKDIIKSRDNDIKRQKPLNLQEAEVEHFIANVENKYREPAYCRKVFEHPLKPVEVVVATVTKEKVKAATPVETKTTANDALPPAPVTKLPVEAPPAPPVSTPTNLVPDIKSALKPRDLAAPLPQLKQGVTFVAAATMVPPPAPTVVKTSPVKQVAKLQREEYFETDVRRPETRYSKPTENRAALFSPPAKQPSPSPEVRRVTRRRAKGL